MIFATACVKNKYRSENAALAIKIDNHLLAAADLKNPLKIRLDNATTAYDHALKSDSTYLVWKAFSVKYPLLQENYPKWSITFLKSYKNSSIFKKDTLNLANAFFEIGKGFAAQQNADSAYFYYNASRILCEKRKDSLAVVEKLTNMAYMHFIYNDFAEFENTTTIGLSFLPKIPKTLLDSIYVSYAYNNFGLAYTNMSESANALNYYKEALLFNKDSAFANSIMNNIGLLFMSNNQYSEAIQTLSKLASSKQVQENTILYSQVLDNLGCSLYKTNDPSYYSHLIHAYDLREKSNDDFGSVVSNIHLAEIYRLKNTELFKNYALTAYKKATQLHSTDDRLSALKLLASAEGKFGTSYIGKYIQVKDSIDLIRQKARNQFAKIKYDSKVANEENVQLKTEQTMRALQVERGYWISGALVISLILFLIIARLLYLLYRKRHRKEKILAAYQTEMRISKKVHDELANDLFNTITFTQTQNVSENSIKETLIAKLDGIYSRARDLSRENSQVGTGINYPLQLRQMIGEFQSLEIKIIIRGLDAMYWNSMEADKKRTVYRVIQELMVNMKKHSQAKHVILQFVSEGKMAKITYNDNGIGMDLSQVYLKNGLQNVENRINAIGGTIIFESEFGKGLQSTILFPPENTSYV